MVAPDHWLSLVTYWLDSPCRHQFNGGLHPDSLLTHLLTQECARKWWLHPESRSIGLESSFFIRSYVPGIGISLPRRPCVNRHQLEITSQPWPEDHSRMIDGLSLRSRSRVGFILLMVVPLSYHSEQQLDPEAHRIEQTIRAGVKRAVESCRYNQSI